MLTISVMYTRKFFRTQMTALGVPVEYTKYMIGHSQNTYHDIQMKGVGFLETSTQQADYP